MRSCLTDWVSVRHSPQTAPPAALTAPPLRWSLTVTAITCRRYRAGTRGEIAMSATNTATKPATNPVKQTKPLPAPNSDFYLFAETLAADELAILKRVRAFMETEVAPI